MLVVLQVTKIFDIFKLRLLNVQEKKGQFALHRSIEMRRTPCRYTTRMNNGVGAKINIYANVTATRITRRC